MGGFIILAINSPRSRSGDISSSDDETNLVICSGSSENLVHGYQHITLRRKGLCPLLGVSVPFKAVAAPLVSDAGKLEVNQQNSC